MRTALITVHAAAAIVSFVAGALALRPRTEAHGAWRFRVYRESLIVASRLSSPRLAWIGLR